MESASKKARSPRLVCHNPGKIVAYRREVVEVVALSQKELEVRVARRTADRGDFVMSVSLAVPLLDLSLAPCTSSLKRKPKNK